jgi:hypothetical protein
MHPSTLHTPVTLLYVLDAHLTTDLSSKACGKILVRVSSSASALGSAYLTSTHSIEYICPKCGHFNPAPRSTRNRVNPSSDVHEPVRRLSQTSDDREGRLPRPNFLAVQQTPEQLRSRSRTRSKSEDISADHPVDDPPPNPHRQYDEPDGNASLMDVDQR